MLKKYWIEGVLLLAFAVYVTVDIAMDQQRRHHETSRPTPSVREYSYPLPGVDAEDLALYALAQDDFDDYYYVHQLRSMVLFGEIHSWLREEEASGDYRGTQTLSAEFSNCVNWKNHSQPIDGLVLHVLAGAELKDPIQSLFVSIEGCPVLEFRDPLQETFLEAGKWQEEHCEYPFLMASRWREIVFLRNSTEKQMFLENPDVMKKYEWLEFPSDWPVTWEDLKKCKIEVWYRYYNHKTGTMSETNRVPAKLERWSPGEVF